MLVRPLHTSVKGRARFRVEGLYRCESLKRHMEEGLALKEGVRDVTASVLTGNLLVLYNSDKTPSLLAATVGELLGDYRRREEKDHRPRSNVSGNGKNRDQIKSRRKLRKLVLHGTGQDAQPWHSMDAGVVLTLTRSDSLSGLSRATWKERIKKYGPNVLPESVPRSGFRIFFSQFRSLPVALLGLAACLSLLTGGIADALVVLAVVGINAVIGFFTESSAEKTIHSLKNLVRPTALVLREGNIGQVSAENVVIGDILVLRPGSYVAADARLVEVRHLSIDESALTGESFPVTKTIDPVSNYQNRDVTDRARTAEADETSHAGNGLAEGVVPLADRTNMIYMGTLVTGGQGFAVVVATGRYTEIGRIQALIGEARPPVTPMERELESIGRSLVLVSGLVCGVVFLVGLARGYGFLQMLKVSISLAVAAVPEGLPTVATTTLAIGIRRMRQHNVLIRRLEAVETLGSIQTICLDKTGTITMNRMTVTEIHSGFERLRVRDGKFLSKSGYVSPHLDGGIHRLIQTCVLCNESELFEANGGYGVSGSPTENALIHLAITAGTDVAGTRAKYRLLKTVHRSETRNIMFTWHEIPASPLRLLALKGSPREVLSLCSVHLKEGRRLSLSDDDRNAIEHANERMAGDALRVLGVGYALVDDGFEIPENGAPRSGRFLWLGIVGMTDPVRPGVKELVQDFHRAGIDTVMITGDQSPTAYAIGKSLNLSNNDELEILDSVALSDIPPDLLKAICERVHIFARVSPAHKLQIVRSLQSSGRIVAMTGDGINDGPALKAAGIGIAMGHTGTDVAREVADVVLEDDNLETMIIAISQGRTIYNNIRKSIHFLLSTNMSEIMVMFVGISLGLGEPLNTMQLLWINLMSDIFPGLALSLEPPESGVLERPPRDSAEPLVRKADYKRIVFESAVLSVGTLGVYGYGVARYGAGPKTNSLGFLSLTFAQLLHALSCRSENRSLFDKVKMEPNRYLSAALAGSFILQGAAMVVPGLRGLLRIAPVSLIDGAVVGAGALIPLLVNEATKTQS